MEPPSSVDQTQLARQVAECLLDAQQTQLTFMASMRNLYIKIGNKEFAFVAESDEEEQEDGVD